MKKKVNTAKEMGLVLMPEKKIRLKNQRELTDGIGADAVIIAVGASSANKQAFEMVRRTEEFVFCGRMLQHQN